MKRCAIPLAAAMLLAPAPAAGQGRDFSCRNEAAEIQCAGAGCSVATDGFTPMELTRRGRTLSLCAYSGCREGRVAYGRSRSGVHFLQARLRPDADAAAGAAADADAGASLLSVLYSPAEGVAQVAWNGFFSVFHCAAPRPG